MEEAFHPDITKANKKYFSVRLTTETLGALSFSKVLMQIREYYCIICISVLLY